jgi:hypothetical protein
MSKPNQTHSYQAALFYTKLVELKSLIYNDLQPAGISLGIQTECHELFDAMEALGNEVETFLDETAL